MDNENKEIIDSSIDTEVTENTEVETVEAVGETLEGEDKIAKLEEQNKRLFERAKKAEERLRSIKKTETPSNQNKNIVETDQITREEVVLIAQGFDEKSIELLKVLQRGKGITLTEAQKDEVFVAFREKQLKENKEAKAKLGVSNSSGTKKDVSVKDMSRDEHKEFFKKMSGL